MQIGQNLGLRLVNLGIYRGRGPNDDFLPDSLHAQTLSQLFVGNGVERDERDEIQRCVDEFVVSDRFFRVDETDHF